MPKKSSRSSRICRRDRHSCDDGDGSLGSTLVRTQRPGRLRVELGGDRVVLAAVLGDHPDRDQVDGAAVVDELGVVEVLHGRTLSAAAVATAAWRPLGAARARRGSRGRVRRPPRRRRGSCGSPAMTCCSHSLACTTGRRSYAFPLQRPVHLAGLVLVVPARPRRVRPGQPDRPDEQQRGDEHPDQPGPHLALEQHDHRQRQRQHRQRDHRGAGRHASRRRARSRCRRTTAG